MKVAVSSWELIDDMEFKSVPSPGQGGWQHLSPSVPVCPDLRPLGTMGVKSGHQAFWQ